MWFIFVLLYLMIVGSIFFYMEKRGHVGDAIEDKIAISAFVMVWPLFLIMVTPWVVSRVPGLFAKKKEEKDGIENMGE